MIAMMTGLLFRVLYLTEEQGISAVAGQQSSYLMQITSSRGTIYDCKGKPLTNQTVRKISAVFPIPSAIERISSLLPAEKRQDLFEKLERGHPALLSDVSGAGEGIYSFQTRLRYAETPIAAHVIGVTDGEGNGISGVEAAYNGWLQSTGNLSIQYEVDALGRVLTGVTPEITNTLDYTKGISLTLDREIQQALEKIAEEGVPTGTIVLSEVATGKIRGLVSRPGFDPNAMAQAMQEENSPLLNRAFSAYNVGSIFKLVVEQTALELGIAMEYECTGTTEVEGVTYQCIGKTAHGRVSMQGALAVSCNCYFIHLAQECGGDLILQKAKQLGFGKEITFTGAWKTESGSLPSATELQNQNALANFSFGQGKLLATPVQIAAMINSIANGGIYRQPTLVEGLVDSSGERLPDGVPTVESVRVMREEIAARLREDMIATVEIGSASTGRPAQGGAGAKTATAETGWYRGDRPVIQTW